VISIDGAKLLCEQRAKSQPICSAASGGLARIQFNSDRDVLHAAHSRRLFIAICGISRRSGFLSAAPPDRESMSLFTRKEDQHSEDRLLANAWSKDYIRVEREGSNRRLVRRESANDANEKVAKANGQNRQRRGQQ
jgi:hypothetical protein